MHCYKDNGHGVVFDTPITIWLIKFLGTVFVDDTDLYTLNLNLHTGDKVFVEMQSSTWSWCSLLNSTGGAAKPEKFL